MKQIEGDDLWLDRLLENPPVIADRAFSRAVEERVKQEKKVRKLVFAGAGLVWLTILKLALPAASVADYIDRLLATGALITDTTRSVFPQYLSLLTTDSVTLSIILAALAAIFALVSVQLSK